MLIPVVFCVDDKYAMPLGVALVSLFENRNPDTQYDVYVLQADVSERNKRRISSIAEAHEGCGVTFIDMSSAYSDSYTRLHVSTACYFRFDIPSVLKEENRAIYLDPDVVILGDLSELFLSELDGAYAGVISDFAGQDLFVKKQPLAPAFGATSYYEYSRDVLLLDESQVSEYFNSGVMLMDLDAWRLYGIPEKLRQFIASHDELVFLDQDALNSVLKGKVKHLSCKWNFQRNLIRFSKSHPEFREEVASGKSDIKIIHYVTRHKPWNNYFIKYRRDWDRYFRMSPYRSERCSRLPVALVARKFVRTLRQKASL